MIKKIITAVFSLMLLVSAAPGLAQAPAPASIPPEVLEALKKEPPLTQADVDAYLKVMPQMPAAMSDPAILVKAYEGAGLTEIRFSYIVSKIALAQALNMGLPPAQINIGQLPEALRPTDADRELVGRNMKALEEATEAMRKNAK